MRKINSLSRKKIAITVAIILIIIGLIILVAFYLLHNQFRNWVDINILRKNISEKDIQTINLNIDKNNQVQVYNKYIDVLNDKTIKLHNSY